MRSSSQYRFPPGLSRNLLWSTFGRFRPPDPIQLFRHLVAAFGDAVHYKLGPRHIVLINHPELIREVLVVENDNFVKERVVRRSRLVLGEGMITAEGQEHWRQRRTAQPAFRRERMPDYSATIVERALSFRETWREGATLDISQEMLRLTMAIAGRALFGVELGAQVDTLNDAVTDIMRLYNFLVMLPAAELYINWPIPQLIRFRRARARLDAAILRFVEQHRDRAGDDLLSLMLRAHESEASGFRRQASDEKASEHLDGRLLDEVKTLLLAGYETTGNALAWTWYLLSQNPYAERRLHNEVDAVLGARSPVIGDVPKLHYAEKVIAESMRLFPPAWAMGRQALADFDLGPYRLPAGTTVLMSQFLVHRDPRWYPDPLRFDPERFAPEARAGQHKFSYFPFGGGPRQCIGEAFAWTEAVLVLATLAQRWRLRLAPDARIEPWPLITLRPKYGMRMNLQARSPQAQAATRELLADS